MDIEKRVNIVIAIFLAFGFVAVVSCATYLCIGLKFSVIFSLFLAALVAFAIWRVLGFVVKRMYKKDKEAAFKKAHPHYEAEKFYRTCWDSGVRNTTTKASITKIKECAKKHSLQMTEQELIDFYLLGQSEVKRFEDEKHQAFLAKLAAEEEEYEKYLTRFANLSAHEKVKAMCSEKALEKREKLEFMKGHRNDGFNSAEKLYNMSKRKEYDWATMGGIASGIGGLGAGVAVAVDAQIKNAEIREQNAQFQKSVYRMAAMGYVNNINEERKIRESAEYWEDKASNAYKLKIQEADMDELLEILSPSVVEKKQNETGSLVMKVKIEPYYSWDLTIGEKRAVIDGTINAVIWKGETRISKATLTLPLDNNGYREAVLEGICRGDALKYGEHYTVTFEPNTLWLAEELIFLPSSRKK